MYDRTAEIGIGYYDMMNMNWAEWTMIDRGYEIRYEKQLDMMRNIMSVLINTAMGNKKKVSPKSILTLPYLDTIKKTFTKVSSESIKKALKRL